MLDPLICENVVTMTRKQYDTLVRDQKILQALEAAGVDNWEGYDEAMGMLGEGESYEDIYGEEKE